MIKTELFSALFGRHNIQITTAKAGHPFRKSACTKEALLNEGLNIDNMVKITEFDSYAGNGYDFKELYAKNAGHEKEVKRERNSNYHWVEGYEGILAQNEETGKICLRIYTDKDHKSRSHFLLNGKKWDDKESYSEYLKPARHINEEANGLVPVSIDIDNIISMKVDGKTII